MKKIITITFLLFFITISGACAQHETLLLPAHPSLRIVLSKEPCKTKKFDTEDFSKSLHVQKVFNTTTLEQAADLCKLEDLFICTISYALEQSKSTLDPEETLFLYLIKKPNPKAPFDIIKTFNYKVKEHHLDRARTLLAKSSQQWPLHEIRIVLPNIEQLTKCGLFIKEKLMPPAPPTTPTERFSPPAYEDVPPPSYSVAVAASKAIAAAAAAARPPSSKN